MADDKKPQSLQVAQKIKAPSAKAALGASEGQDATASTMDFIQAAKGAILNPAAIPKVVVAVLPKEAQGMGFQATANFFAALGGKLLPNPGAKLLQQGEGALNMLAGKLGGKGLGLGARSGQMAGGFMEQVGKGLDLAGDAALKGGKTAMSSGKALSSTLVGAIVGVPLIILGATAVTAGATAKVSGKTLKITGKLTKKASKVYKTSRKAFQKIKKAVRTATAPIRATAALYRSVYHRAEGMKASLMGNEGEANSHHAKAKAMSAKSRAIMRPLQAREMANLRRLATAIGRKFGLRSKPATQTLRGRSARVAKIKAPAGLLLRTALKTVRRLGRGTRNTLAPATTTMTGARKARRRAGQGANTLPHAQQGAKKPSLLTQAKDAIQKVTGVAQQAKGSVERVSTAQTATAQAATAPAPSPGGSLTPQQVDLIAAFKQRRLL